MADAGEEAALADGIRVEVGGARREQLERHLAVETRVARAVDLAEDTAPDPLAQLELPGEITGLAASLSREDDLVPIGMSDDGSVLMAIDPGTISAAPTPLATRAAIICPGVSAPADRRLAIAFSTLVHAVFWVRIAPTTTSKAVSAGHHCCGPKWLRRSRKTL